MAITTVLNQCRLCESSDLSEILSLAATPAGDLYVSSQQKARNLPLFPLDLVQCQKCGHAQLKDLVDPAYVYSNYIYTTSSSLGLKEHFRAYAQEVYDRLKLTPGSLVVEMGSNEGILLAEFQKLGLQVLGVDPAREIAKQATAKGIPTIGAFFTAELAKEIASKHGQASIFIANNVMANVESPTAIMEGVKELLKPGGFFVMETGYLKYLAESYYYDNIYHEHIDYYSIAPLFHFFNRLGLALTDVKGTDSKGSSIRCYVQNSINSGKATNEVQAFLDRETQHGYATAKPYIRLRDHLSKNREALHLLLDRLIQEGKTIAGYGASIGTTTTLYHFNLGDKINTLIDDNPLRCGLYSPGFGLPVVSSQCLEGAHAPDYVLILAWRYAKPIIDRNKKYIDRGGKFIKFMPDVEICSP